MKVFNFKQVITHTGKFTAEDVFGVALLRMINPSIKIIFTDEPAKAYREAQSIFEPALMYKVSDYNSINYFSILWKEFGYLICSEQSKRKFLEKEFIPDITGDNSLTRAIEAVNKTELSRDTDIIAFHRAMNIAIILFKNIIAHAKLLEEEK